MGSRRLEQDENYGPFAVASRSAKRIAGSSAPFGVLQRSMKETGRVVYAGRPSASPRVVELAATGC